ncbi:MAG TPA: hypothetical protein VGM11_13670 [Acidobacteriaceae bacterium]|jgi:hypothetical protein
MRVLRPLALPALAALVVVLPMRAQDAPAAGDPPGVAEALAGLSSQRADATAITFDRQMLDTLLSGNRIAGFNSVTFQHYQYPEPAFYIPEEMHALEEAYRAAGWKHLVDAGTDPREMTSPTKPEADLWFHWQGGDIDHMTVVIRGRRDMNVIHVSGLFRPMDIVKLSGHLGIPKVDPGAVMVPAPPGR